jgi:hypothetical protein
LPAFTIAELYRCRWQVELFFKWIKQHLRIRAFFGTSENAVKSQIWIADVGLRPGRHREKTAQAPGSLYQILQILSLTLFEKTPMDRLLSHAVRDQIDIGSAKQAEHYSTNVRDTSGTPPLFLQSSTDYRCARKRGVSPFSRIRPKVVQAGAEESIAMIVPARSTRPRR